MVAEMQQGSTTWRHKLFLNKIIPNNMKGGGGEIISNYKKPKRPNGVTFASAIPERRCAFSRILLFG
jgi:hypothetical protein